MCICFRKVTGDMNAAQLDDDVVIVEGIATGSSNLNEFCQDFKFNFKYSANIYIFDFNHFLMASLLLLDDYFEPNFAIF